MRRVTKTLQLIEGQDDDLIAWFSRLPSGKGQRAMKDALRKGISGSNGGGYSPITSSPPDDLLGALLNSIHSLPQAISAALVPALMQVAVQPQFPPPSANYVPAYQPPEPAYKIKRPSLEQSFDRAQNIIDNANSAIDNAEDALDDALALASGRFVNQFG